LAFAAKVSRSPGLFDPVYRPRAVRTRFGLSIVNAPVGIGTAVNAFTNIYVIAGNRGAEIDRFTKHRYYLYPKFGGPLSRNRIGRFPRVDPGQKHSFGCVNVPEPANFGLIE
jgi:hypothetical protein